MNYKTIAVCVGLFATGISMAETRLPIVEILGNKYYVYETKKDETLFGIARRYKWDDKELRRMNPKAVSPLTKGFKLYYPVENEPAAIVVSDPSTLPAEPITHLVKKGETVYSISMLYNIPVDVIYSLNPESKEGIKEGEMLKMRRSSVRKSDENPDFYTVKKGDTLYGVARKFNTSVAAIMKLNPGVSESNFQSEATIKIPANGTDVKRVDTLMVQPQVSSFSPYTVSKEDTWESISEKTGIEKAELIEANSNVKKLKKNTVIGIPNIETDTLQVSNVYIDPREESSAGVREIYADTHSILADSTGKGINVAILMSEPNARKDLDFTRGFLTGIDKLKRADYKISLKVIDGTQNSETVIESLDSFDPDIVFTTTDRNIPGYMADYALVSNTPVVNTFDIKDENYVNNPYFIQLLTPSNYFNESIANYLADSYHGANLIFVGQKDTSDQLASVLQDKWAGEDTFSLSSPEQLEEVTFWDSDDYLIYGYPTKKNEVTELLDEVQKIKENNPNVRIGLLGRPNWIVYDESLLDKLNASGAMIPSRFYYDKDSYDSRRFLSDYKSLFDMSPVKSYPMYAALGYDSATYFIPEMISTGGDFNKMKLSRNAVQSNFAIERPANWSGMINPVVYIVKFAPFGGIEKIEVR